ncbi:MAG: lytic transglycosylase, partial [Idiomarina sp.]|nr:lytic transglycosylase [Idiomarina sp.]
MLTNTIKFTGLALCLASAVTLSAPAFAYQDTDKKAKEESSEQVDQQFATYVEALKAEAIESGYKQDTLDKAFAKVKYYERAVELDKNQPEFKLTLDTYLPRAVPEWKADKALEKYNEHKELLEKVGKEYGVQPRFIVALWGIETNFGSFTGGFDVVSALTTLAFDG